MKPAMWWKPGLSAGWLSRTWAQGYVFPLPALKRSELEVSLRFKVQALLPSPDLPLSTRFFSHQGTLYGLALLDRLPVPKPPTQDLFLGMPLVVPSSWPQSCLLAVATPEGWEIHAYEKRILSASYPPVQTGSPVVQKILAHYPEQRVFWTVPDQECNPVPPRWAQQAPDWPSTRPWGIPWNAPKQPRWPWVVGGLLLAAGLAAWVLAGSALLQGKQERNRQWESWLGSARTLAGAPALSAQKLAAAQSKAGEPLDDLLSALARAWPSGVEIRRLEVSDGKLSLTARAPSALTAVSNLSKQALGTRVRVVQIRPFPGGEEFDLEGKVAP